MKYKDTEELKEMAKSGDEDAQYELAKCYYLGKGVEKNLDFALKILKEVVKRGHNTTAIRELGVHYAKVENNEDAAVEYFQKAADLGDTL